MTLPSQEDLPEESVAVILDIIRGSGFRTVHYTGHADEALLRGLLAIEPRITLSVMDMPDRWKTGFAFFWDEDEFPGIPCPERPDWLEGIPFYQEGAPDHDIGIRDWPWDSSDQPDRIVRFKGRVPPKLWILFGFADMTRVGYEGIGKDGRWERGSMLRPAPFQHPSYEWEKLGEIWIGRWIPGQPPLTPYPDDDDDEDDPDP